MKVAVIQIAAGPDRAKNLSLAAQKITQAASRGARFILLPETFNYRGNDKPSALAEKIPGPSLRSLIPLAQKWGVWILAGSIGQKCPPKTLNTSVLISPRGKIRCLYRKIHLFSARVGGKRINERAYTIAGKSGAMARIDGFKTGLAICYDLRFPELFRQYSLKGAQILVLPSNFTYETGKAHWEILVRARAIENQCYVLAPNQHGVGARGVRFFGTSLIVDPWGKVLAKAPSKGDAVLYAELKRSVLKNYRSKLPALKHRRLG